MRTTIEIPFATAARGARTRAGRLEPVLLVDSVTIAVDVVQPEELVPAATVRIPGGFDQTVWSLDGEPVRPVEMDRLDRDVAGPRRVTAETLLADVLQGDGWELIDWRREVPEAVFASVCFDAQGGYDHDYALARPKALKAVEHHHREEAADRLERVSSRLLVVGGEVWTRCPAPRLVVDNPAGGPYVAASSDVHDLSRMDPDRSGRQFFALSRLDDALAFCDAAVSDWQIEAGPPPSFDIHHPGAIAFDDLVETALMVAVPTLSDLGRDLAWFSADALDDFATARAAALRLRAAPAREDALIMFEAFSRIAADRGDPCGLFEAPGSGLMRRLERFGLRAGSFETEAVPDLAIGAPAP
jgi:hypothetical protein